jgi:hypothetical protein
MFQADIEDHRDSGEGGEGRGELAVFELREHRGGEARVFAEIDQSDFAAETEGAEFASEVVRGEDALDGFRAAFGGGKFDVSHTEFLG